MSDRIDEALADLRRLRDDPEGWTFSECRRRLTNAIPSVRDVLESQAAELARLRAELARVTVIAHDGGLLNLSANDALIAIRRLTVGRFPKGGTLADRRLTLFAALAQGPPA